MVQQVILPLMNKNNFGRESLVVCHRMSVHWWTTEEVPVDSTDRSGFEQDEFASN